MRHAAGLSIGFWKHAVGTTVHVYNMTLISKAEFLTPKEMWSGSKPDISHLRIIGCAAYVHVLMSNQQVRSADYLGMQSVTACNDTCIRGD